MIKEPKVGMRVEIVKRQFSFGRYENGDIGVIDAVTEGGWWVVFPNQPQRSYVYIEEFKII